MATTRLPAVLWHFEHSIQSSGGELAEERLWLLSVAVPRGHYEHSCIQAVPGGTTMNVLHAPSFSINFGQDFS